MLETYKMFIGGQWVSAMSGQSFETDNPFTGRPWALIPRATAADADRAVTAAHTAFSSGEWPKLSASRRGALLRKLADLVSERSQALAETEVRDNGKLWVEMSGQTAYIAQWLHYYAGLADKIEGSVIPLEKRDYLNYTRQEPLGVVLVIVPWNSPLLLAAWKMAPALAAGNTVVVKPSEYTSASILEFMRLVEQAGFPPGVVNVVTGFGTEVGMPLVEHPRVAKVAFTGSDATGQHIYQAAARGMKRVTMELGGKSPNIVFEDADLGSAANGVVSGILAASGQTCVAGSRLLVQESIHDAFMERLVALFRTARLGDPMSSETQVGPIATRPQLEKILKYIDIAIAEKATLVAGGQRASASGLSEGWFVEPTIFDRVTNRMRIAQEEVFGPVLSVISFKDEEEAVSVGNDVVYGLAAGVWTQSIRRALTMTERLQAGTVWVNTYRANSYMSPFGGYKRSGFGREGGKDMILDYLQVKSVWISTAQDVANPFVQR
jgi:aldehyde dehydrogenase (NAD+)